MSFSENGIGWNSECQTGATQRCADLDKLRIPADEREATHLDILGEESCFALFFILSEPRNDRNRGGGNA